MHNKELFLLQILFSHNSPKVQAKVVDETIKLQLEKKGTKHETKALKQWKNNC